MFVKQLLIVAPVLVVLASLKGQSDSSERMRVSIEDYDSFEASSHAIAVADRDSAGLSSESQAGIRREQTEQVRTLNRRALMWLSP
jgi:hypothetical protein